MAKRYGRFQSSFSTVLVALMDEKGMTVRKAAKIADVGSSTIDSWRRGAQPGNYLAVKKLARALGTTMSFLLTGEDESRPNGITPSVAEAFSDGELVFDGYARVRIQQLVPRNSIPTRRRRRIIARRKG
ncbi:MAG: helix-turn-helix transcriptional regulator [Deltaproteobacteria bacterium]|nr:helix-turn-helix transcriptional regulator [Deltaproteobacteria bacterium]